jgi:YD repeat-containing protein
MMASPVSKSENTPEAGTITYSYTNGGSACSGDPSKLCSKSDQRPVTTTYQYDALNRVKQITYSDGTPGSNYSYDASSVWGISLSNTKGRLTQDSSDNGSIQRVFSYDAAGRLVNEWECLPSNCGGSTYNAALGYDLAGNLTSLTYPSGRTVTYAVGNAGRPTQVTFANAYGQPTNYVDSIKYAPQGSESTVSFTSGLTQTLSYNNRLELTESKLASSVLTAADHTLGYADHGANNGLITGITDTLNSARTQNFTYDYMNR